MPCGDIAWWRDPDILGLLERHGQAEHLAIQVDFVFQVWRDPRAEFSIPGASKSASGSTGYADIVAIETREIWEIKPKHLEPKAFDEARRYVVYAQANCGLSWVAGSSYTASSRLGGGGVVYRVEGGGHRAELIAEQGRPGVVTYVWRIDGKEVQLRDAPRFSWAIRAQVVKDFFTAGQPPQPLPGAKAPDNLPPVKFKPPVLRPDGCIPQLTKYIPKLLKSILTTCQQTVVDNSTVAILLEERMVDALVGRDVVASQIANLQVTASDPTVRLYREAMAVLTGAGAAHGVPGLVIVIGVALYLVIEGIVELIGAAIVFACEAVLAAGASATLTGGLTAGLAASVRAALSARAALTAGAGLVAFAIPRASMANPSKPVSFDISFAQFVVRKPGDVPLPIGKSFDVNGARWIVVGQAGT
jgi:hypothetical protein